MLFFVYLKKKYKYILNDTNDKIKTNKNEGPAIKKEKEKIGNLTKKKFKEEMKRK